MSKPTLLGVVAAIAVLVICATPFLARWSLGTRATTGPQPLPAASPLSAASLSPASSVPEPTESNADRLNSEGLQAESQRLSRTNAALDEARQKAEAGKNRAEANTEAMAMLTGKLLDQSLKVPRTTAEAGSLAGRNLADAARFKQKWGDAIPAAGTPEADEYAREKEALVGGSAAFLKFMADGENSARLAQPDGIAQFQAGSLAGALDLRADQVQGISTTLDGYYRQFYAQGLNAAAQPQTGTDVWQQQRTALSRQSYAAVSAFLTPEQATAFQRMYPPAGSWMLTATIADVPGLQEN